MESVSVFFVENKHSVIYQTWTKLSSDLSGAFTIRDLWSLYNNMWINSVIIDSINVAHLLTWQTSPAQP